MKKCLRFIPAIIWMIVIYYFSSRSTSNVSISYKYHFLFFKSLHLIEYAVLAFLLFFAFLNYKYTIFTAYLYAIFDEIHQHFIPGRNGKFSDTLFDLLGIIIGIYIYKYTEKKLKNRL
jgi:VanZ family protein